MKSIKQVKEETKEWNCTEAKLEQLFIELLGNEDFPHLGSNK